MVAVLLVLREEAGCFVCQWSFSAVLVVFVIVTQWLLSKQ